MLTDPLPNTLDVRRAAVRGVSVSGTLKPLNLQRFRALLASDEGSIQVELAFDRDEEGRHLIQVRVSAEICVVCQRCLEPMSRTLSSDNTLAVVWTDEQAAHLPKHLDPLIAPEEGCNLWDLVEDELILALPAFSYHDTDVCREKLAGYVIPDSSQEPEPDKPNPFDVLAQLKPGKVNQE